MSGLLVAEPGAPVWKRTVYACGCVLDAAVRRDAEFPGLIGWPRPPLSCPVHRAIWVNADTRSRDVA